MQRLSDTRPPTLNSACAKQLHRCSSAVVDVRTRFQCQHLLASHCATRCPARLYHAVVHLYIRVSGPSRRDFAKLRSGLGFRVRLRLSTQRRPCVSSRRDQIRRSPPSGSQRDSSNLTNFKWTVLMSSKLAEQQSPPDYIHSPCCLQPRCPCSRSSSSLRASVCASSRDSLFRHLAGSPPKPRLAIRNHDQKAIAVSH